MYGQNAGDEYIASTITLDNGRDAVRKRVGVSVVKDSATGDYIVKLVNMLPVEVSSKVEFKGISFVNPAVQKTVLTGSPRDENIVPVKEEMEVQEQGFTYTLPSYSFTVIRIGQKQD